MKYFLFIFTFLSVIYQNSLFSSQWLNGKEPISSEWKLISHLGIVNEITDNGCLFTLTWGENHSTEIAREAFLQLNPFIEYLQNNGMTHPPYYVTCVAPTPENEDGGLTIGFVIPQRMLLNIQVGTIEKDTSSAKGMLYPNTYSVQELEIQRNRDGKLDEDKIFLTNVRRHYQYLNLTLEELKKHNTEQPSISSRAPKTTLETKQAYLNGFLTGISIATIIYFCLHIFFTRLDKNLV